MEHFTTDLELKTVDLPQRIISGYAAIHQVPDKVHDVIDPSASAKAVARLGSPQDIAVFVGHDTKSLPVGLPQVIEATPQGLYTETYILKGPVGDNLLAVAKDLIDHGQSLGMSIGYKTRDSRHESVSTPGKTRRVRRLLDFELKEYSFAAQQAIAHPEALVASVKTASAAVAPSPPSTPPSARSADADVYGDGEGSAWASKTHAPDGDAARAARREQARAELERCDLEARTAQAEADLRRARHSELAAELDEIGRWQTRFEREQWNREYDRRQQTMEQLRALANDPLPTVPVTRAELEADPAGLQAAGLIVF
jgi:HK97 family phage prohead protease